MMSLPSQPKVFVEPFTGGGIISLTAAFEFLADRVVMVELDKQIAVVWETILGGDAKWLAKKLLTFELTPESAKGELAKPPQSRRDFAFQTILKNRTAHGGILADGAGVLKNGENGKGILSRWYTVAKKHNNPKLKPKFMKIEFVEDVNLALRRNLDGRISKHRRFKLGEVHRIEFLGEDSDAETIDVRFEDGYLALKVARLAVALQN